MSQEHMCNTPNQTFEFGELFDHIGVVIITIGLISLIFETEIKLGLL